jgi:hypothetical protein
MLPGTIILTAAEHEAMLYVGRVILGFGVGFAIQVRLLTCHSSLQSQWLHADRHPTAPRCCCDWQVCNHATVQLLTCLCLLCCSARLVSLFSLRASLVPHLALCDIVHTLLLTSACPYSNMFASFLRAAVDCLCAVCMQCTTRESRM